VVKAEKKSWPQTVKGDLPTRWHNTDSWRSTMAPALIRIKEGDTFRVKDGEDPTDERARGVL